MTDKRVRIFVTGKVQGVFFRQSLKVTAKKNNATGWVKNLEDGRVEALLEGSASDVNHVLEWCNTGPANSRVKSVEIKNEDHTGEFSKFDVLY